LKGPNTYVLDVRGPDEIATARLSVEDGVTWVTTPCSKAECPGLEADAEALLPDRDATVVVHCASGIRANTARQTLERLGYTNVLNAGGLQDVMAYLQEE
jgi:phage shock protein E